MDYFCDERDKTIENESKRKHLKCLTHNEVEKFIRLKHTISSPNTFDIDEIFNEYNTKNKKIDLYLAKKEFILIFDKEFYPPIKSDLKNNLTRLHLKMFLLLWIQNIKETGRRFSHICEMCITTISNKGYMTYEFLIK